MLTSDHSIVHYSAGNAMPDRLTRRTHAHYLAYAQRMLAVYRSGVGLARRELHQSVRNVLAGEPDCDHRRVGAFCKLLDDAGEFDQDRRGAAAELRLAVFTAAARFHPLVTEADQIFQRTESEAKRLLAAELGRASWAEVDAELYRDVLDRQALVEFDPDRRFDEPAALLSAYNVGQLQACLYRATRMTVHAAADLATIVRQAKFAGLLVEATRTQRDGNDEYRIDLTGPASALHATSRYGVAFARFTASLLACRGWRMRAGVRTPWGREAEVLVDADDGYRSHLPAPPAFDSEVERAFAEKWGESPRDDWRLLREAGVLQSGQATFVPDFLLRHDDGREVFLEIVGFWTPQYLQKKRQTLATFRGHRILLAIPQRSAKARATESPGVIVYKTRIKPDAVVAAAEAVTRPIANERL